MRYIKESKYDWYLLIGIIMFLLFSNYVVPFTHELGHVLALKYFHCNYWANLEYGFFKMFYGEIYERCILTPKQNAIIYISGVGLTFVLGVLLLIIEYSLHRKHRIEMGMVVLFISYSFLLDLVNYLFFKEGDILEFMRIAGLQQKVNYLPIVGILMIVLLMTYMYVDLSKEFHVVIEEEEHLLKKIWKKMRRKTVQ